MIEDLLTEPCIRSREDVLVAEAKGAAAAAASGVAAQHVADISRRLGGMVERLRVIAERKPLSLAGR